MQDFLPCTTPRAIGDGIFFRPIKSWHSGTYAGEGLYKIPNTNDGSGCLRRDMQSYQRLCPQPLTATHRLYWHERDTTKIVSSFLSYPSGMGAVDEYFWEIYPCANGDMDRFTGPDAEAEMEQAIKLWFSGAAS